MELNTIVGGSIGTNSYLVVDNNKAIAFDYTPELHQHIKKNNIELTALCITHVHFDHIEGLESFLSQNQDLVVYCSKEAQENINNPKYTLDYRVETNINTDSFITLQDEESFEWNGHNIVTHKTPGHSIDSMSYYIKDLAMIVCGDLVFFRSVGRTDFVGGNFNTLLDSIKRLFELYPEETEIHPGHGPSTTIGGEVKYNSFLK